MKSQAFVIRALLIAAAVILIACDRAPQTAQAEPEKPKTGGITIIRAVEPSILLEAEAGKVNAPVAIFADTDDKVEGGPRKDASGGKYALATEGPKHEEINKGGDVTYRLRVEAPGVYVLWVRAHWVGACGNSLDVSLDGDFVGWVEDATYEKWHWVQLLKPLPALTAGDHMLAIGNREDGSAWDQILLTRDKDYRPAGIESADAPKRTVSPPPETPKP